MGSDRGFLQRAWGESRRLSGPPGVAAPRLLSAALKFPSGLLFPITKV